LKFTHRGGTVKVLVDVLRQDSTVKAHRSSSPATSLLQVRKVLQIKVMDTGHGISKVPSLLLLLLQSMIDQKLPMDN